MIDVLKEPFELGAALCPVALVLVARFQQQGVLLVKPIEALLAQRLHHCPALWAVLTIQWAKPAATGA